MVSARVLGLMLGFRVRVMVVSLWVVEPYSGLARSHVRVVVWVGDGFVRKILLFQVGASLAPINSRPVNLSSSTLGDVLKRMNNVLYLEFNMEELLLRSLCVCTLCAVTEFST